MISSVEEIHMIILRIAAEKANRFWAKLGPVSAPQPYRPGERFNVQARRKRNPHIAGEVFRPDPIRSRRGGLSLSVDPLITARLSEDEIKDLHWVGVESVRDTLKENPHLLGSLILGEARAGRNYFDRFNR